MRKKKEIKIEFKEENFKIPQINYTLDNLIKGKSKFVPSEIASPFHGTNVVDKKHYIDNSGAVDIDYGYDYLRDQKHISDEEQIRRHGTKYYEFTFLNDQLTDEQKRGSDYSKKKTKNYEKNNVEPDTLSSFFEDIDEEVPVINEPEIDLGDDLSDFKINISLDDDDNYEYNSFDDKLHKPSQTTIPSYLKNDEEEKPKPKVKFEEYKEPVEEIYEEPQNDYYEEEPTVYEPIEEPVVTKKENKYDDYYIPVNRLFHKSEMEDLEVPEWLEEKKNIINESLKAFGIDGEVITYTKGPAFTRYEIMLAQNVNVKRVNNIYDNIQMALRVKSLRIQAPIPGKNTVGIEVPNDVADVVKFGDILTEDYLNNNKNLQLAIGKDIDGNPVFQNIIDMPHALIAGATKSGKSVCINTLLVSLLIKNSPEQLKLILVDPKKVELSFYNNLPHLATPVIDNPIIATEALKWAVNEMERRYELLSINRVRNIEDYNRKRQNKPILENLPFIVIVVDEFNDLVMQCSVEANDAIVRLAQKARAAGIHIILATQRPTVNVVSGTIKANITCRIAFKVATDQDSRIILDEQGAESLLGRGDMLVKNNGLPERVQGAYISDEEIADICDYICDRYEPDFMFTHEELKKSNSKSNGYSKDDVQESEDLLYEIAKHCLENNNFSINSIMKVFGLGFNRADRIMEEFSRRGIIGEKQGTKSREILVDAYGLSKIFNMEE